MPVRGPTNRRTHASRVCASVSLLLTPAPLDVDDNSGDSGDGCESEHSYESDVDGDSDGYYPGLDIAHAHARAVGRTE